MVGLLPPAEKELSYGGGTVLGSTSVAIAVAEKGESAVSLSMRRIPVQPSAQQIPPPYPTRREEKKEVMWSPIREPVKAPIWSPIREPLNISQNYELWSPTPGPITVDANDEELWSPTPESERASGSIFKEETIPAPAFLGTSSVAASDSTMREKIVPDVPTSRQIVVPQVSASRQIVVPQVSTSLVAGPSSDLSSKRRAATRGSDVTGVEMDSSSHAAPKAKPSPRIAEGFASPVEGVKKDETTTLIDSDGLQVATNAVEQLKKGKRKPLQEDE